MCDSNHLNRGLPPMRWQSRMRKEPVVSNPITWVGLDAHKSFIQVAVVRDTESKQWRINHTPSQVRSLAKRLTRDYPGEIRCCYEAGPCGFGLKRRLRQSPIVPVALHQMLLRGEVIADIGVQEVDGPSRHPRDTPGSSCVPWSRSPPSAPPPRSPPRYADRLHSVINKKALHAFQADEYRKLLQGDDSRSLLKRSDPSSRAVGDQEAP